MKYPHPVVRVSVLDESLDFYCNEPGLEEPARKNVRKIRQPAPQG